MNSFAEDLFIMSGGRFAHSPEDFKAKLAGIKAIVFDWDGVFNDGRKSGSGHSGFSEVDSMGINMMRFGFWLRDKKQLPISAIISGADNDMARYYAEREHFHNISTGVKNKREELLKLCDQHGIKPEEVMFFFDDIIDLSAAELCGLRIFVRREASLMTTQFVEKNKLFDYIPFNYSSRNALRESCELVMGTMGLFDKIVKCRMAFEGEYAEYLQMRNSVELSKK